jgi:predicted metal-dependent phosphoesterase TrpH
VKPKFANPFETPGKWYKGNFHLHTRTSDGGVWVEDAVRMYRERGYDVLAITDHINTNDIDGLSDKKMLVINGAELHPPFHKRINPNVEYHICAIGLKHGEPFTRKSMRNVQDCLDYIHKVGAVAIMAHPKDVSLNVQKEMLDLKHLSGLEVWTYLSEIDCDKGNNEQEWAEAMEHGMFLSAVGSDDTHWAERHGWQEAFGSWTMLKMPSLTEANVLEALRTGATYASGGPVVKDFRVVDGKVSIKCSPVERIHFKYLGERLNRWAKLDTTINSHSADVSHWEWVRAEVVDANGRKAWTNPIPVT